MVMKQTGSSSPAGGLVITRSWPIQMEHSCAYFEEIALIDMATNKKEGSGKG